MTTHRIEAAFIFTCTFTLAMALAMLATRAHAAEPAPPNCSGPAVKADPDPMLGFRCATEANLRAMIADPEDLDRGRARSPAAGDAAFAAARRDRLDDLKSKDVEAKATPKAMIDKAYK